MSESSPSDRRRWLRWGALSVALFLLLVLFAHALWGWYAQRRLDAAIAQLRAAGEPMEVEQLPDPGVSDDQNASLDYLAAGRLINQKSDAWQKWDADSNEPGSYKLPLTPAEAGNFVAIAAENGKPLAGVAGARSKRPGAWGDVFRKPYFSSYVDFSSPRMVAHLLHIAVFDAHTRGRDDETVAYARDLLRLTDAAAQRPTLIGHLVAVGIGALAAQTIDDVSVDLQVGDGGGAADRSAVDALLQHLLDQRPLMNSRRLAWQSERIFQLDAGYQFLDGGLVPFAGGPGAPTGGVGTLFAYLNKPLTLQDMRLATQNIQDVMKATEADDWPAAQRFFPTRFNQTMDAHPMTHIFGRIMSPALDRAAHASYRGVADRRLAAAALAIRLYAVDHDGQLPATLDQLVPKYLPAVPIDPLSGEPLHYTPSGNAPCVYSLGDDGVDDHGTPADRKLGMSKYGPKGDIVVVLKRQPRPAPATTQP
jgi:hypothetical protein